MLANKVNELHFVAVKYNHVLSVMAYVGDVIRAMTDTWEDGLLTVDKKMERYAKVKAGSQYDALLCVFVLQLEVL